MRVIEGGKGFRARLSESIKRIGLTQAALARRLGVERAAVNAWVNGRRTPDLEMTRKMAAIFGWSTAEMLSWFGVYEEVAQKERQNADASVRDSAMLPAPAGDVTTPVTVPPHTGAEDPRNQELVDVPSPDHRALYAMLAALTVTELAPVAQVAAAAFLRHFGGAREESAEGHPRRAADGT